MHDVDAVCVWISAREGDTVDGQGEILLAAAPSNQRTIFPRALRGGAELFVRDVTEMIGRDGATIHIDAGNDDKSVFGNKFQQFSIIVSAKILSCFKHLDEIDSGGDAFGLCAMNARAEENRLDVRLVADV